MICTTFVNDVNCFTGRSIHATPPATYRTPPKLNRAHALAIRADHADGMSYRAMSAKHGLARNTLFCVVKYRGAYAGLL